MNLILQHTTRAFSGDIPEGQWRDGKHFRTLATARAAKDEAVHEMHDRCGTGWDCHYRVVNAGQLPIRLKRTISCYGSYRTHAHSVVCHDEITIKWDWLPGDPEPQMPQPDGWHGYTCPACHTLDAAYEAQMQASYKAERAKYER